MIWIMDSMNTKEKILNLLETAGERELDLIYRILKKMMEVKD